MSAKRFIDTNVLAYAFDHHDQARRRTAKRVLRELAASRSGVVSTQVMQELYSVLTRKLAIEPRAARRAVAGAAHYEVVTLTPGMVLEAIDCAALEHLSIWDSLVIIAAAAARCEEVLTEDLNPGQVIRGVRVVNPLA